MQTILVLDEKNYDDSMPVLERYGVRAIIRRGNLIAMQQSASGDYKIPGGGMNPGESVVEALAREVREETGLVIIPESMRELGEIVEIRRDIFDDNTKYIAHSYHYLCDAKEETVATEMTESEIKRGYHPVWADIDTIIETNEKMMTEKWQFRDVEFLKWLKKC